MLKSHYDYIIEHFALVENVRVIKANHLKHFDTSTLVVRCEPCDKTRFFIGTACKSAVLFADFKSRRRATTVLKFIKDTEILFI